MNRAKVIADDKTLDGYQRGLAEMVYSFFKKKSKSITYIYNMEDYFYHQLFYIK